jgi:hypothetical protein
MATRIAFAMPACESNMKRQRSAATTVGIAQGRSEVARAAPRPRNALFMASAITRPRTSSRETVTPVKNSVWPNDDQKRGSPASST